MITDQTIPDCAAVRWRGWCPGTSRTGTAHRSTGRRAFARVGPGPGRHATRWRWNTRTRRRGKSIVVLGIVLAIAAGGAAFFLINQAQQQAGQGELQKAAVVVAIRPIPARKPVEPVDIDVRQVPIDATNAEGS